MVEIKIVVGLQLFSVGEEYLWLVECDEDGVVVIFIGKVCNYNFGDSVKVLIFEYYLGMIEKVLVEIVDEVCNCWLLGCVMVIYCIGELWLGDEIVFVGVISEYCSSVFEVGQFIMDYFKICVLFWKCEVMLEGDCWVEVWESDQQVVKCWQFFVSWIRYCCVW